MTRRVLIAGVILTSLLVTTATANADIITFILKGNGGFGLLGANENPIVTGGGSGGFLTPITYDTDTNMLTLNLGWGSGHSGQGFTDMTGTVTAAHIHGPTAGSYSTAFSQNAGVLINLSGLLNNSATMGGINGVISIAQANEAQLLAGRMYINAHTSMNVGGEIRGNLFAIPEPASGLLGLIGIGALASMRRRRV